MPSPPRLTAVVVHYGAYAPTRRCLESLAGIDEVILVDQHPTPFGSHPNVTRRIDTRTNLGFAAACNRGVAVATAPFVLLLNNDAALAPGAADALHAALDALPDDAAGACLKLLDMDGTTLQSAGGLWFTRDGIGFPHGFGERDDGQYDRLVDSEIGVPSGAAALYRTDAWHEAGGMAAGFFCYCEDGDLGLRLVAAGRRFAWLPDVRVLHDLSSSSGAHSRLKAFHVERNHFLTMAHSAPAAMLAALPLRTASRLARTLVDALRGRGAGGAIAGSLPPIALAVTLVGAWLDAAAMLPDAWSRRRELQRRHPDAQRRVERFLSTKVAGLREFAQRRSR